MENREFVRFLIPVFILGLFIFTANNAFAYEIKTHAYLTDEIIKFYNQNFPNNKVPNEFNPYLIDGSRREDDNPRYLNHFYDPVYNRGLTYDPAIDPMNYGNWQKSKNWAQDSNNQNSLSYKVPATVASVLTAIEQRKISAISSETNFVWQEAIRYYVQGEKEKAFFTLGHILHLIEDTSVPDHTRNDAHPKGSPYEDYASQFTLSNTDKNLVKRVSAKAFITLDNLDFYFEELAQYSNNNFYSKDSIGIQSGYSLPSPDDHERINDILFARNRDEEGFYRLSSQPIQSSVLMGIKGEITIDDNKVLSDYWSRLSVKAVQYGAGVINLFFQAAEAAKNDPNFVKTQNKSFIAQAVETAQKLIGNVGSAVNGIISSTKEFLAGSDAGFEQVGEISLNENTQSLPDKTGLSQLKSDSNQGNKQKEVIPPAPLKAENGENSEEPPVAKPDNKQDKNVLPKKQEQKSAPKSLTSTSTAATSSISTATTQQVSAAIKQCSFNTSQSPSHEKVIINEVAWMGGINSASDEWIELKNISASQIDLSGWQLLDVSEDIKVVFGEEDKRKIINKLIPAGGLYLLERTNDDSVVGVMANFVYTGALSNDGQSKPEGLRLFDSQCNLIDEVMASPDWPAGDNTSAAERKTMERDLSGFGWYTSSLAGGTPKRENSQLTATIYSSGGGGSAASASQIDSTSLINHIVISEIQTSSNASSSEELVELYNPTDSLVSLDGWSLKRKATLTSSEQNLVSKASGNFSGKNIAAKSFLLIASNQYAGSQAPDVRYSQDSVFLADNGDSILLYDANDNLIDEVDYGAIDSGQSWERKALQGSTCVTAQNSGEFLGNGCDTDSASDFEIRTTSNPQNSQGLPEPRSAPAAVQNFNIAYTSSSLELVFDWQPALSTTSSTNLVYEIQEYASPGMVIFRTTSTAQLRKTIDEVGRNYNFSIQVFDKDGLGSAMSSTTIAVPSFFSALYFYDDPRGGTEDLIDSYYSQYPFVTNSPGSYNWRLVIFYLNSDAIKGSNIEAEPWQPADLSHVLAIKHRHCSGGGITSENTLILPDASSRCGTSGGAYSRALSWSELEDNHFIVQAGDLTTDSRFSSSTPSTNYLAAAFYSTYGTARMDGLVPYFRLAAVDKTKYYFGNRPAQQAPRLNNPLNATFDRPNSRLNLNWPAAADEDTLDSNLRYEIQYSSSSGWEALGGANNASRLVSPGDSLSISVRAKDDFGNYASTTLMQSWVYPETQFYISQTNTSSFGGVFGHKDGASNQEVSVQSIVSSTDFQFDKVVLRIRQSMGRDFAGVRLSVYPDNGDNQPDFSAQPTSTQIGPISRPDENQDLTFTFANPISVSAGIKYWLVLDVAGYYVGSQWAAFQDNQWQNAVSSGNPYTEGVSGRATCHDGFPCQGFIANTDSDWYMKIGLTP